MMYTLCGFVVGMLAGILITILMKGKTNEHKTNRWFK
jgi:uncharacterized membrane-anchored protein YhcB (DUF1043 family)